MDIAIQFDNTRFFEKSVNWSMKDAQKIKTFLPDLVFMDIRLPGESGLELTKRIKASHPEIAIIILTAYDLHPENPKKLTDIPTSKKLLTAFSKITLTIIESKNSVARHLTPLSQLQINILERLGLNAATYTKLEIRQSVNIFNE